MGPQAAMGAIGAGWEGAWNIAGDIIQANRNIQSDAELINAIRAVTGIELTPDQLLQIKAERVTPEQDVGSPETKGAQLEALRRLSGIATQGGMDPQSMAALRQAEESSQRQLSNNSAAMMRGQMARGTLSSGSTMAANLAGGQESANMLNRSGVQAAGDARQRALQAIAQSGSLASQIAGMDDERAMQNKKAREQIKMFNAEAALKAAQSTAGNMLGKDNAEIAKANAQGAAAANYANQGKDRDKPYKGIGKSGNKLITGVGGSVAGGGV